MSRALSNRRPNHVEKNDYMNLGGYRILLIVAVLIV
jgi:hypothetical protein